MTRKIIKSVGLSALIFIPVVSFLALCRFSSPTSYEKYKAGVKEREVSSPSKRELQKQFLNLKTGFETYSDGKLVEDNYRAKTLDETFGKLKDVLKGADKDRNGLLDATEFKECRQIFEEEIEKYYRGMWAVR